MGYLAGTYLKEPSLSGDKPYWIKDNQYAIWSRGGRWRIGAINYLGQDNSGIVTQSRSALSCPELPANKWQYWGYTSNSKEKAWQSADNSEIKVVTAYRRRTHV